MPAVILLVASLYVLPDAKVPRPNEAEQKRIVSALEQIRTGSEQVDRAVRDLALVGEAALPSIVKRLNVAEAGERLLLLSAVRRMPRGQPLWKQARKDPSPAIRAWVAAPPVRAPVDLRRMAGRYLDLLALAEEKRRIDVDKDLEGLTPVVGRPIATFDSVRARMRDRRLADDVQRERTRAAVRFARTGAVALRAGRLAPAVDDPVFMAYLSLVEEEGTPPFYAVPALVSTGAKLIPVLHWCLNRENHDPRVILRILFAVDSERSVYRRFTAQRPDVQRALVTLAPEDVALLEQAALAADGSVRAEALEALLRLDAPAGLAPARKLLDPVAYGPNEFRRAARLLARAGEVEPLATWAELKIPDDESDRAMELRKLQQVCASALRTHGGKPAAKLADRFLAAKGTRLLGMDLVLDPGKLLALARAETDEVYAFTLARRALERGGKAVAKEVIAILKRGGRKVPLSVLQALRNKGCVDELVELAREQDAALGQLARLTSIDVKHEAALLELHRKAKAAEVDPSRTLEALLPLGTKKVQEEYARAAPDDALGALAGHAEGRERAPISIALLALVKGATAERLRRINQCASVQKSVEPGLFYALFQAWDAIPSNRETQPSTFDGPGRRKVEVFAALARSNDSKSAEFFFADLLAGKFKDPPFLLGTLKAASRLLPAGRVAALMPLLQELRAGEYPLASRQPPPWDGYRQTLLLRGVIALGIAQADAALPMLCDMALDPKLQSEAYAFRSYSQLPYWSLDALRYYTPVRVNAAFREALRRAEVDGRLAALHPVHLHGLTVYGRQRRPRGRNLHEVRLALCEVLERLPWEGDVLYEKMRALGGLRRYKLAARTARTAAERRRARGYNATDGFRTAAYFDGRARLYDGLAAGKLDAALGDDPFLLNLAAWYALFYARDESIAARAAEKAVRLSAGLYHAYRDTLAAVRIRQGRPQAAMRLLDARSELPVKRPAGSGWHLYFRAQAELLLDDPRVARQDLAHALEDRRLIPTARREPAFQAFSDLFRQVDEEFFDDTFAWETR